MQDPEKPDESPKKRQKRLASTQGGLRGQAEGTRSTHDGASNLVHQHRR